MEQLYLSRRNLLTLLSKLDRRKAGGLTFCSLVKQDNQHPVYPQTMDQCVITAVEDEEYYTDRQPGTVHPADEVFNKV
jgi:hypothetical protein